MQGHKTDVVQSTQPWLHHENFYTALMLTLVHTKSERIPRAPAPLSTVETGTFVDRNTDFIYNKNNPLCLPHTRRKNGSQNNWFRTPDLDLPFV